MGFFSDITGGSLLNAGLGIVTSLLGNSRRRQRKQAELQDEFNARNQQRQYDYQTQLNQQAQEYNLQNMEIQNQYAMDNWLAQQEYNSPENQLKRVKDAGLNPNMVLGQGQITNATNSVPDTPDSSSPSGGSAGSFQTDVPYVDSPLKAAYQSAIQGLQTSLQYQSIQQDIRNKRAQEAYTYADTRRTMEDTLKKQEETYYQTLKNYEQEFKNSKLPEQYQIDLELKKEEINKTRSMIHNLDANSALAKGNLDLSIESANESRRKQKLIEAQEQGQIIRNSIDAWIDNYQRTHNKLPTGSGLTEGIHHLLEGAGFGQWGQKWTELTKGKGIFGYAFDYAKSKIKQLGKKNKK